MLTLEAAIIKAFEDLENSYQCSWRSGKGSKEKLIKAFSQKETPAYQYLGFKGSDGLRHAFGRAIPTLDKPSGVKWETWLLDRLGMHYCYKCSMVHEQHDTTCKSLDREETRKLVSEYICNYLLHNPCDICGETDIIVLEFDHIDPGTKSFDIGNRAYKSLDIVKQEMSKCRVLCSNCHKRHTAKTQNHYKWLFSEKIKCLA